MSRQFFTLARQIVTLPLSLLAVLLCLGALAAQPAHAGISIQSVSGVPNPVPAAGVAVPALSDCAGTSSAVQGSVTVTNANGKIVSFNPVNYYQPDADGNPIVYAYAVFPALNSGNGTSSYTMNVTVTGGDGTTATQSIALTQGQGVPIAFNSIVPTPATLQSTDTSVSAIAHITANGTNQAGYLNGAAYLYNGAGAAIGVSALQSQGNDNTGNPILVATFSGIPVNTSSSVQTYTIAFQARDKTGVWSYSSIAITQLAGGTNPTPAATSLAVASASGTVGQSATLTATLTASGAPVSGKSVAFQVDGATVGSATTDGNGLASLPYAIPANATIGKHSLSAAFAGDSADAASKGISILTTVKPTPAATSLAVASASGTVGQSATLTATLTASGAPVSGKSVAFQVDGATVGSATTDGNGLASLPYAIPASANVGSHSIAASFAGDSGDAASTGTGTLTASAPVITGISTSLTMTSPTGKAGQTVHLIGRLRRNSDHTALVGEKLTFSVDGTVVGTVAGTVLTNSAGFAVDYYLVTASLTPGSHTLTVSFNGDSAYTSSSASGTLTITN